MRAPRGLTWKHDRDVRCHEGGGSLWGQGAPGPRLRDLLSVTDAMWGVSYRYGTGAPDDGNGGADLQGAPTRGLIARRAATLCLSQGRYYGHCWPITRWRSYHIINTYFPENPATLITIFILH